VLDLACGRGASALMLAQAYQCRVAGVDINAATIQQGQKEAHHNRLEDLVTFIQSDATRLPFASSTFSAALCECAISLFPDRPSAFSEIARVLQPAGYFALSDFTFRPAALPEPIDIPLARALGIPLGMGPEAYVRLAEEAGFIVERQTDYSSAVAQLLDKIESLLGIARLATVGGESDGEPLSRITGALHCTRDLVRQGDLGYWAFVSRRR
jgi:arsenite methyltransferase